MTALRIRLARRVATILNTGPIGGFGKESINIDTILTPVDFMGLGIPDPLAHLAALVSVDILQLGASRAAPGRACIDVPLNYSLKTSHTNQKAYRLPPAHQLLTGLEIATGNREQRFFGVLIRPG